MSGKPEPTPNLLSDAASLQGKAVVISGGSTGMGRATAVLLASQGARVLIFAVAQPEIDDALTDIRKAGGEAFGVVADQSREEDIERVFQEADNLLGGVDILVNNAAVNAFSILQGDYTDWQYVVNTNLLGYMACAHEAIERMKKRGGGRIVNIGSISANMREANRELYVATKAAVQGFSESLRRTVAPHGIGVSLIEPGVVGTNMIGSDTKEQEKQEEARKILKAEDIAQCVLYCLTRPPRCNIVSVEIQPHFGL